MTGMHVNAVAPDGAGFDLCGPADAPCINPFLIR